MDRRQQKTREAIFSAFDRLLSRKRYSNITVQEIIDEANIGRSTFYAHFETKDDLLREMCGDMFAHVVSAGLTYETTHDFSGMDWPESVVTHILYHLRDSNRNITGILRCESGELFMRYFKTYLNDVFRACYGERIAKCRSLPPELLIGHISSSFVEMINWWIQNDMAQTPEEVCGYFTAVIKPVIDSL